MSNESKTVIGYKGFDKGLTCRGIQFEIGKETKHEGEIKLCNKGLHFCENPLDVLRYYGPAKSEYAEVKAQGVSDETEKDSKRVCSSLTLTAKISLKAIITAGVSFLITAAKKKPDEPGKPVGYSSPSATSGNSSPSATSGKNSIACAIGREATAKSTVGNWLVLSEYDSEGNVKTVKTVKVDGKEIKADTFYKLIDGKFVKAE